MGELELRDQVLVEALGPLGLGMDQQATAADGIAKAGHPGDHIQQQGSAKALAFMVLVYSQTSQQGDGLGRRR